MIKFVKDGEDRGDCTASYKVILDKKYMVWEFIWEVINNNKEWGYIGIRNKDEPFFGKPKCEYRDGFIFNSEFTSPVLHQIVSSAKAEGGWTRMDYLLDLEVND